MKYLSEKERKNKWYHDHRDRVSAQRRKRRDEKRIEQGKLTVEEEQKIKIYNDQLKIVACRVIKAREEGKPDPIPVSSEVEKMIKSLYALREKRRAQCKTAYQRFTQAKREREEFDRYIRKADRLMTNDLVRVDPFDEEEV